MVKYLNWDYPKTFCLNFLLQSHLTSAFIFSYLINETLLAYWLANCSELMSKLHDEMSMTKSVAKSKFPLRKSLKYFMWTSLVKRRLLAMFCKILHISVRPRFILGVGSMSTRPYSCGLMSTGLMKRKNMTVPTAWKPAWRNLCDTMECKQWHTMRTWSGNTLAELTMAFMTLWVSWRRFWRFSSTFSFGSTRDGSTFV